MPAEAGAWGGQHPSPIDTALFWESWADHRPDPYFLTSWAHMGLGGGRRVEQLHRDASGLGNNPDASGLGMGRLSPLRTLPERDFWDKPPCCDRLLQRLCLLSQPQLGDRPLKGGPEPGHGTNLCLPLRLGTPSHCSPEHNTQVTEWVQAPWPILQTWEIRAQGRTRQYWWSQRGRTCSPVGTCHPQDCLRSTPWEWLSHHDHHLPALSQLGTVPRSQPEAAAVRPSGKTEVKGRGPWVPACVSLLLWASWGLSPQLWVGQHTPPAMLPVCQFRGFLRGSPGHVSPAPPAPQPALLGPLLGPLLGLPGPHPT